MHPPPGALSYRSPAGAVLTLAKGGLRVSTPNICRNNDLPAGCVRPARSDRKLKLAALSDPSPHPSVSPDLAGLIRSAAGGDRDAFARLYDAVSPAVYGVAVRILRDAAEAEEAALDVFLQVWNQAKRFDDRRGTAMSWILMLARSRAIDRLRSRRMVREKERPIAPGMNPGGPADVPLEDAWAGEQREIIRRALSELPEPQRRALELAYFEGLTHLELAERLGEPVGTVKTRIRLGLMKLRERLRPVVSQEGASA